LFFSVRLSVYDTGVVRYGIDFGKRRIVFPGAFYIFGTVEISYINLLTR